MTMGVKKVIRKLAWVASVLSNPETEAVNNFHRLYYQSGQQTWHSTFWMGVKILKCPLDMWVYQEVMHETRPDLIIETGTAFGGSALYLAHLCDIFQQGQVVTIDIEDRPKPSHPRIRYLVGSSTSPEVVREVESMASGKQSVMVILDSDHSKAHVLEELKIYSKFVTESGYLFVEDTNVNGHPVFPTFGPGPMEAIEEFLTKDHDFAIDKEREKFFMTFNPNGFLRKK